MKGEGRCTGDGEVAEELVAVGGAEPLDEVDARELAADDGGHVERVELVEGTAQLEGLDVVLQASWEAIRGSVGDGEGLGLLCGSLLGGVDDRGGDGLDFESLRGGLRRGDLGDFSDGLDGQSLGDNLLNHLGGDLDGAWRHGDGEGRGSVNEICELDCGMMLLSTLMTF